MPTRILVIEDEPAIADTLIYALTTEGYEPVWCTTGQAALASLQQGTFGLAILDVGLPDMNGFDLLREIQRRCGVPVIFLTARSSEIDRIVGLELGADDYISKPFSPREVCARVRMVLRRTQRSEILTSTPALAGQQSSIGTRANPDSGIVVNEEKKAISYHGHALELSRTEYRLLKVLVERPGRVYSRQDLMALAWEHPDVSLDRTVDAHIKQLRSKLRAIAPDQDPIQTHRGMGYSFKEQP